MAHDRLTTPQERQAAWRAAFSGDGDIESLQPVIRAALAATQADHQAALRAAYTPLADDASDDEIGRGEADAFLKLLGPVRDRLLAGKDAPPALPEPVTALEAAKLPRPPRLLAASGEDGAVLSEG